MSTNYEISLSLACPIIFQVSTNHFIYFQKTTVGCFYKQNSYLFDDLNSRSVVRCIKNLWIAI